MKGGWERGLGNEERETEVEVGTEGKGDRQRLVVEEGRDGGRHKQII